MYVYYKNVGAYGPAKNIRPSKREGRSSEDRTFCKETLHI